MGLIKKNEQSLVHLRPFLRIDAYVGADATSICSDTFFLVGNTNVCPLPPDQTFFNIGFSTDTPAGMVVVRDRSFRDLSWVGK
jgi:hypothetical protein